MTSLEIIPVPIPPGLASMRSTKLDDRWADELSLDKFERVGI